MEKLTTRLILEKYHRMGNQEALRNWRENVPKDVRKMWIRSFILEKGVDSLSGEIDLFRSIVEKNINPDKRVELSELFRRIDRLHKDHQELKPDRADDSGDDFDDEEDETIELYSDLEWFIASNVNDKMLAEFSEKYFLTFDENQKAIDIFIENQKQKIDHVCDYLGILLKDNGTILRKIYKTFPMGISDNPLSIREIDEKFFVDLPELCSLVVVYGSSAIGPRRSDSTYPRIQDNDLMLIPKSDDNYLNLYYPSFWTIIGYADQLVQRMIEDENYFGEAIGRISPETVEILRYLTREENHIDLFVPKLSKIGKASEWRKLCGPHRIVKTFNPSWEKDYKFFLEKYIEKAREEDELFQGKSNEH